MLLAEGTSPEKRQSNPPVDCSALILEMNVTTTTCPQLSAFMSSVDEVTDPSSPEWNTRQNREWLEDTLNDFCTSDCLSYTVEYYSQQNCTWPSEYGMGLINLYQNYYCGSSNKTGQYCLVEIMEYMADTTAFLDLALQCPSTEDMTCSPVCLEVLEGYQEELGCCAVNLFNTTASPFTYPYTGFEAIFERCGLSLMPADVCSGALRNTIVSPLLLFLVTTLSVFSLS